MSWQDGSQGISYLELVQDYLGTNGIDRDTGVHATR